MSTEIKKVNLVTLSSPRKIVKQNEQIVTKIPLQKTGIKKTLDQNNKKKCKFFPFCKSEGTCPYFHPTQKCAFFPHCRYAEKCLYIHEICKFGDRCARFDCVFAHNRKSSIKEFIEAFVEASKSYNMSSESLEGSKTAQ